MKKLLTIIYVCMFSTSLFSQVSELPISIIPQPVALARTQGSFSLPSSLAIVTANENELKQAIDFLKLRFSSAAGIAITVGANSISPSIKLILAKNPEDLIGEEGYRLSVTPSGITITANKPAGIFYGAQSLVQLFPAAIESAELVKEVKWEAPAVEITDYPRFGWRGLMFDVARHFFTKDEVKQFIDEMVRYKFNLLHLHLTDDEGWRIQIKSLPKLTEIGAWNVKKTGYFGTFTKPLDNEPRDYGGFYTQDDIRDIVQYAKERFVNILPEIDVPGHSLAAIASYPELSCTPGADKYKVGSGDTFMIWTGPRNYALVDNTLCPANEKVYEFLDKVFTEVAALFPFDYIHVGGDECAKNFWEINPQIKALMQREKLKDMHQVQSYFEKRLQKIVVSKGKKFLGWDEILEGGLAPGAAVMSWRGIKGGVEAAKMGHEVVMSPHTYAYLDFMQSDPITEPRVYATLRLNTAYSFEPVPDGVESKYIKGGQANLWTEQVTNMRHLQYMLWPRSMAIAESVWSPKEKKNWNNFFGRVENHFQRFDIADKKYSPAVYDPIFVPAKKSDSTFKITLQKEVESLDIYYSFDNSFPDNHYAKYTVPLIPPKDAVMLKVITYEGKKPVGRMIAMPISELKKRVR
ncbi:MAG: family 20 glycosylhydrolase [Flavitalea sp.]